MYLCGLCVCFSNNRFVLWFWAIFDASFWFSRKIRFADYRGVIVLSNIDKEKGGLNPLFQSLSNSSYHFTSVDFYNAKGRSHKLFELLHIGDALDILFLLEPLLDGRSIEIQSVTLADKRNVVTSHVRYTADFDFPSILQTSSTLINSPSSGCGCCFFFFLGKVVFYQLSPL